MTQNIIWLNVFSFHLCISGHHWKDGFFVLLDFYLWHQFRCWFHLLPSLKMSLSLISFQTFLTNPWREGPTESSKVISESVKWETWLFLSHFLQFLHVVLKAQEGYGHGYTLVIYRRLHSARGSSGSVSLNTSSFDLHFFVQSFYH